MEAAVRQLDWCSDGSPGTGVGNSIQASTSRAQLAPRTQHRANVASMSPASYMSFSVTCVIHEPLCHLRYTCLYVTCVIHELP